MCVYNFCTAATECFGKVTSHLELLLILFHAATNLSLFRGAFNATDEHKVWCHCEVQTDFTFSPPECLSAKKKTVRSFI